MDSRKHEHRPSLGREGLPLTKTSRCRNHGRIPASSQNSFLGPNCEQATETSETISLESVEHRVTGKPVPKARPQLKVAVTLSPVSIPIRERKWIDINPERFVKIVLQWQKR